MIDLVEKRFREDFHHKLYKKGGNLFVNFPVFYAGDKYAFYLKVSQGSKGFLEVREDRRSQRLPSFCPERHINFDGSFCLQYGKRDALRPENGEDVSVLWHLIYGFLELQVKAEVLGRWPSSREWAHGDAASHQQICEGILRCVGVSEPEKLMTHLYMKNKSDGGRPFLISGMPPNLSRKFTFHYFKKKGSERKFIAYIRHLARYQQRKLACCGFSLECPVRKACADGK